MLEIDKITICGKHETNKIEIRIYRQQKPTPRIAIINPALGIRSSYYIEYAKHLVLQGFDAILYDYQLDAYPDGEKPSFATWAQRDYKTIINYVDSLEQYKQLYVIGHSIGGTFIGMQPIPTKLKGIVLIATQSGFWGHWPGISKFAILFFSYILIPLLTKIFKKTPGRFFQLGYDIPSDVALNWARWARHRDFILHQKKSFAKLYFSEIKCPILWYSFADDHLFAPPPAVKAMTRFFPHAKINLFAVAPKDYHLPAIGHNGYFKERCKPSLWVQTVDWLNDQSKVRLCTK